LQARLSTSQKVPTLQKYHDYTWKLLSASEDAQHSNELLAVTCDSIKGEVTLTKADGLLLTIIYIRHQSFFTVVKFKWQNSSYRWGIKANPFLSIQCNMASCCIHNFLSDLL
jgi:hypothetical protein